MSQKLTEKNFGFCIDMELSSKFNALPYLPDTVEEQKLGYDSNFQINNYFKSRKIVKMLHIQYKIPDGPPIKRYNIKK